MKKFLSIFSVISLIFAMALSVSAKSVNVFSPVKQNKSEQIAVCVDTFYFLPDEFGYEKINIESVESVTVLLTGERFIYCFFNVAEKSQVDIAAVQNEISALPYVMCVGDEAYRIYTDICESGYSGDAVFVEIANDSDKSVFLPSDFGKDVSEIMEYDIDGTVYLCLILNAPLQQKVQELYSEICTLDYVKNAEICSATALVEEYLYGDFDMDGSITATDARMILRLSVGLENADIKRYYICDTDMDDEVTSSDARAALRISVGLDETKSGLFSIWSF